MKKNKVYTILIALLIYSNCIAQKSDYIVTELNDTIYVDKISLTDTKLKTKTNGKKKKYNLDKIISFYDLDENKHYERLTNEVKEKKVLSESDRYNYRKLENLHIEDYENRIKYSFIERLTNGKVKLFTQGSKYTVFDKSQSPSEFMPATYDNIVYYISIYDSKLELINYDRKSKSFFVDGKFIEIDNYRKLRLTKEVFEILKIYLHDNEEIKRRLEQLFVSKPIAKEDKIIELINDYNKWVELNK